MQCRDTNRNRHIDFLVFILNNEMIDCFKDLTDNHFGTSQIITGKQDIEFFTTGAIQLDLLVIGGQDRCDRGGNFLQNAVPCKVPVRVINVLKVINIEHHHR